MAWVKKLLGSHVIDDSKPIIPKKEPVIIHKNKRQYLEDAIDRFTTSITKIETRMWNYPTDGLLLKFIKARKEYFENQLKNLKDD